MTVEEKLKDYILSEYKSLRNFVQTSGIDLPYTTVDGMFKRGIRKTSIDNVIKLCQTLNISIDALGDGEILPIENINVPITLQTNDIGVIVQQVLNNVDEYSHLSLDGKIMSKDERLEIFESFMASIELMRRKRQRANEKNHEIRLPFEF